MTKHDQYNLIFRKKWVEQANTFSYSVRSGTTDEQTKTLAYIVESFFKQTAGSIFQEIENWEDGLPYDNDFIEVESLGGAEWLLKLAPPNVLYYNDN